MTSTRSLLILGGSSVYMLLLFQALSNSDLWRRLHRLTLFGRHRQRLAFLAQAAAAQAGACQVVYSDDYAHCVAEGHDLVFNQMRIGGLESRDLDERIAIECGLVADETLGIVGVSNAIRTLQGMAPFIEPLLVLSQRPRWINFSNPCSIITQHLVNTLDAGTIGICDYPEVFHRKIAAFLGRQLSRVQIGYFGLNHMAFVHDIRLDGEPVLDQVLARVEQFELGIPAQAHHDVLMVPSWELVFNPAHLHTVQLAQRNRASVLLDIERACQHLVDRGERDPACYWELLSQRNCDWYGIAVAPLLALCLGKESGEAIVNIAVGDVFELGLPHCVVETNAVVDADGARALAIPEAVRNHELFDQCRAAKQAESLLLTSILNQDYATLLVACQMHPMIRSPRAVARYFSRLTESDPQIARFVFGNRPIPWPAHTEEIR